MLKELNEAIAEELRYRENLELDFENIRIKAAKYKCLFFGKKDLAYRISEREFKAIGRREPLTLEELVKENVITPSEYSYCNAL